MIPLTLAELSLAQCALREAIGATMVMQMSADEAGFRAMSKQIDLYEALHRKLRRMEKSHAARPDPAKLPEVE